jgi:membrane-bound metal-dependent hydrolase YbcI (DUF457 family)
MPSPIAHLSVGYVIYRLNKDNLPVDKRKILAIPLQMAAVAGLSMLPDLDAVLGIAFGDMAKYHNNFTHSLFFGLVAALAAAAVFHWVYQAKFWKWFLICLLSYELHVVMDMFAGERGVMLLWPFSADRFVAPFKLFYGMQWGLGWFSLWHLWTIFTESLFALFAIFGAMYWEKRKPRKNKFASQEA